VCALLHQLLLGQPLPGLLHDWHHSCTVEVASLLCHFPTPHITFCRCIAICLNVMAMMSLLLLVK
jgi:hypothetical protein